MYHALSYFACYVSTLNKSSTEWLWMHSFKSYYCKGKMSAKISDMIKNKALLSHYVLLKIIRYKFLDLSLSNESARLLFCSLKALHAFWFFIDHMVLSWLFSCTKYLRIILMKSTKSSCIFKSKSLTFREKSTFGRNYKPIKHMLLQKYQTPFGRHQMYFRSV